jgi:predicted DsbA family dithiol-disulfide isomerase
MPARLTVAVFSDVVCPWCFVGKRRLERALDQLRWRGQVPLRWLPFELNPDMPPGGMPRTLYRAQKFGRERADELDRQMTALGAAEGIRFAFDRIEVTPNTRRAHILIAHASREDKGDAVAEALFRAYFEDARDIGRGEVLVEVAATIGLDRDGAAAALDDAALAASVIELESDAARLGIAGVPFFIVENRWALSGAQPTEVWVEALQRLARGGAEMQAS